MKQGKKITNLIPKYAILPLAGMLILNMITYFLVPILTKNMRSFDLSMPVDSLIPMTPVFIIPYVLAFAQWIIGYIAIARTDEAYCKRICYSEMIAKLIVMLCFILIPTTMVRPEITSTGMLSKAVALLYSIDAPTRLFPSIHCLESWMVFRGSMNRKYFSKTYTVCMGICSVLVCMSTVLIKQHLFIDIVGGIAVVEIGLLVTRRKCENADSNSSLLQL